MTSTPRPSSTPRTPYARRAVPALLLVPAVAGLAACTSNATTDTAAGDPRTLTVSSSADDCTLSATSAPAGTLRFDVTNAGDAVTEFYLLGADGLRIVGEVENIGPQLERQLVVNAPAGTYTTACKPGMKGDGIRATFTVTPAEGSDAPSTSADDRALVTAAERNYATYVHDQADQLVEATAAFVAAYEKGDDDRARALYAPARVHWERIETVAESFGDLDPKTDAREADLAPGEKWTGWHRIEKDLWPQRAGAGYTPLTAAQRTTYGDDLLTNIRTLQTRVKKEDAYPVDQIANGSRGLLEEVATGKVTGEEEYWSRTDLWDFQANVDGARVAYEGLQPVVEKNDPALAEELTTEFAALQDLLDSQRVGDGFKRYDQLTPAEVKGLANAVDALSEPLSKLTAAVV